MVLGVIAKVPNSRSSSYHSMLFHAEVCEVENQMEQIDHAGVLNFSTTEWDQNTVQNEKSSDMI